MSVPNTHTRVHDLDYRVTRITSDLPVTGTQPYFDRQFSWDAMSRIGAMQDLANSALDATYGYDSLDRLTSTTQGTSSWGYTYDGIGNRLTSTVGAASTTYNYFSNTHRLQGLSGAQSKSYGFDAAGNMTSDGTTGWVYGGNGRPTSAGGTAFAINALGQRVMKGSGTAAIRFAYDDWKLLGEYDAAGAVIQETVWLGELPVATLRPNGGGGTDVFYVHTDQLGTPRAVTRPSDNQLVWKWDNTEAFGNSAPDENPGGLGSFEYNLRFPGQYFDAETGTHYNYFRDYDPSIGRYNQSDPIGLRGGLDTFGFVNGAPLALADLIGLTPSDVNGVMRDVQRGNPTFVPPGRGLDTHRSAVQTGVIPIGRERSSSIQVGRESPASPLTSTARFTSCCSMKACTVRITFSSDRSLIISPSITVRRMPRGNFETRQGLSGAIQTRGQ